MQNHLIAIGAGVLFAAAASCSHKAVEARYDIIPLPDEIILDADAAPFTLTRTTRVIASDSSLLDAAEIFCQNIATQTGITLTTGVGEAADGAINLSFGPTPSDSPEAYTIAVSSTDISIGGASAAGVFYALQTLRAGIPAEKVSAVEFPAAYITDSPRFGYRGAHLDVARHFFPTDSVKVFLDMMALHKLNRFHWHLTDHQGWRAEIKSRPRLTEVGSKRPHTVIGKSQDFDSIPVEGYYTREEMLDIVDYAAKRNIEVIPEIDVPGHTAAALASYPELGCTGGPYEVYCGWGGAPDDALCPGTEAVYAFLDDVFGELTEIFPSTLFHIGGDECAKTVWEKCPRCQALADSLGYKDDARGTREAKLQNYLMKHVADFLEARGKRVIGWDEVMESDFAPNALVMSWRGESGGIEAARRGHEVIMSPNRPLYFDFYQSTDIEHEPLAIGSYNPVSDVYAYDPVPAVLDSVQRTRILGPQANLWTEYVPTFDYVQYMELPRMAALGEIAWTNPEKKDLKSFVRRLPQLMGIYRNNGWRYATHIFDVQGTVTPDSDAGTLTIALSTYDNSPIRYTIDGSEPTLTSPLYSEPIVLDKPATVLAAAEREGGLGSTYRAGIVFSKATFKPVELHPAPHPRYAFDGAKQLTDGVTGTSGYASGEWLGFTAPEVTATIDLGEAQSIEEVRFRDNVDTGAWIFGATRARVEVSTDGKNFTEVVSETYPEPTFHITKVFERSLEFAPVEARFVRLTTGTQSSMPQWHPGVGKQAFIFIDEIGIY